MRWGYDVSHSLVEECWAGDSHLIVPTELIICVISRYFLRQGFSTHDTSRVPTLDHSVTDGGKISTFMNPDVKEIGTFFLETS